MNKTSISYLTHTWNPLAMRCTRISPACDHCWHLVMANRLAKNPMIHPQAQAAYAGKAKPVLIADRLDEPSKRKKSSIIGTQFMGDLFHPDVPEDFVWAVIGTAYEAPQHTFLILTKRPARMLDVLTKSAWWNNDTPRNIWLGVTVENQQTADERRADFEAVPGAVKFVSYEPALGTIDWTGWEFVDQIISGGETGPGARPSHPDWHRGARDFCIEYGKSYFFKQWGAHVPCLYSHGITPPRLGNGYSVVFSEPVEYPGLQHYNTKQLSDLPEAQLMLRVRNAGNLLNGKAWRQMPEVRK